MIHTGDCLDVMRTLPEASVDAVVTDPPYGLEFMGKAWDSAKSWDSRDGSEGSVGKWKDGRKQSSGYGSLLRAGVPARYVAGQSFQTWCEAWGREALRVTVPGGYLLAFGGTRTHHRLVCGLEDAGWVIRDELDWIYASGFPKGKANLKPAHEPIVLARKPGPLRMLAIDECRIGTDGGTKAINFGENRGDKYGGGQGKPTNDIEDIGAGRWPANVILTSPVFDGGVDGVVGGGETAARGNVQPTKRDVLTEGWGHIGSGPDGPVDPGDSGTYSRFFLIPKADRADREPVLRGQVERTKAGAMSGAETRPDRPTNHPMRENAHPTVKPIELMRHLVRLVTPPGGTILDPFLGSGTTAIAAEMEGFAWLGIEKEAEYVAIAEARLNGVQRGLGLDVPAPTRKRVSKDGVAVRHNSGGNTFGGDKPKPPMADMTYRRVRPKPVPVEAAEELRWPLAEEPA